jgi:hypothetical protein
MTWISVEERLPAIGSTVFVWRPGFESPEYAMRMARYRGTARWSTVPGQWEIRATHWAELPEGPGEGRGK